MHCVSKEYDSRFSRPNMLNPVQDRLVTIGRSKFNVMKRKFVPSYVCVCMPGFLIGKSFQKVTKHDVIVKFV
jgi:hypothetical protein